MRFDTRQIPLAAVAVTALCLTFAIGCGGGDDAEPTPMPTATPAAADVDVTDLRLGRDWSNGAFGDETDTFAADDTIYAVVDTEGSARDVELTARWLYEGDEDEQEVDTTRQRLSLDGSATAEFHVSKPDGWPTGDYRVEILVDGETVEEAGFEVE